MYTDLATGEQEGWDGEPNTYINKFPGYEYIQFGEDGHQHNMYRGTDLGFGGYVFAQPGMYNNVVLLDIASLHPHSIQAMNCFGEYTKNFTDIMDARIAIKRKKFDDAKLLFNGKLTPYLNDESQAKSLSQALKIAINSVYGLTSAKFDNPFRDIRNKNNIVAVRGALFMRTLQDEVTKRGYKVAHIKTDSIKIPDADQSIIDFCMEFANKYGYTFEHEATYEKMCLVNDAVYIAKYSNDEKINGDHAGQWTATGTQFQVPYVFKTLFSKEPIEFDDLCETKSVKTALYLDYNENLPPVAAEEAELSKITTKFRKNIISEGEYNTKSAELNDIIATGHDYRFVGKVGNFCPVLPGNGGGLLVAERNGKYDSVVGTKGYRWIESELLRNGDHNIIDKSYYNKLVDDAVENISQYGDFEMFVD